MTVTSETRTCLGCKGSKITVQEAFTYHHDRDAQGAPLLGSRVTNYPRTERPCLSCNGRGNFPALDCDAIAKAIKGRDPRKLCSKRPVDARAYYVWRMARFHGGADVTMPMGASMDVRNDPFRVELDTMADTVARMVFKTDLAGAHRWGRVLGMIDRDMPGLPDSAYSGGRVADKDKPIEEQAELI